LIFPITYNDSRERNPFYAMDLNTITVAAVTILYAPEISHLGLAPVPGVVRATGRVGLCVQRTLQARKTGLEDSRGQFRTNRAPVLAASVVSAAAFGVVAL